jgi:hypothetical protein
LRTGGKKTERVKGKVRLGTLAGYALLILFLGLAIYIIMPTQPATTTKLPTQSTTFAKSSKRAAIVDQLSANSPNQGFTDTTRELMQQAGLTIDLYPQNSVTVGLYGSLPAAGYELIVFRAHAGLDQQLPGHPVGLYTAETYNESSYVQEQLADLVAVGRGYSSSDTTVFAVTPKFIEQRSAANYPGTVIILMGCYGLFSQQLPQAFIDRGASVVIGWDKLVGLNRTDTATLSLLRHLLKEKLSVSGSVEATIREVGPDPYYKSILGYYPRSNGDTTLSQNISRISIAPLATTDQQKKTSECPCRVVNHYSKV